MNYGVGKKYISVEHGVTIKVTSIDSSNSTDIIVHCIIISSSNEEIPVGCYAFVDGCSLSDSLKPLEYTKNKVLIKKTDCFRVSHSSNLLEDLVEELNDIYDEVKIQSIGKYWAFECVRFEFE